MSEEPAVDDRRMSAEAGVGGGLAVAESGVDPETRDVRSSGRPRHKWAPRLLAFAATCLLFAAFAYSVRRGRSLQRTDPEIYLGAAPLVGRNFRDGWDWRFGWGLAGAAAVAGVLVLTVRAGWWERARLRIVVAASGLAAGLFGVALALTDGLDGLRFGAADETEYWAGLDRIPPAGEFVRRFSEDIRDYSVHVRGHPPGFVLLLKAIAAVGPDGVWPVIALSIAGAVLLPIGVLVTVRSVAGDSAARRAAPFLAVSPYVLWMLTSADSVYAAVGALGTAAIVIAVRRSTRASVALAAVGGVLLGLLLFGTYLGAVFCLIPAVAAMRWWPTDRRAVIRVLVTAAVGGGLVVIAFKLAGFWWFDGVAATKVEYWNGSAQFRRFSYFGVANLAAAAMALGPASVIGGWRLRDRRVWIVVGAGLAALAVSHLSRYTKGEVERIWLLFYPWLAVAAVGLWRGRSRGFVAAMVAVQATAAIVLQAALVSKW